MIVASGGARAGSPCFNKTNACAASWVAVSAPAPAPEAAAEVALLEGLHIVRDLLFSISWLRSSIHIDIEQDLLCIGKEMSHLSRTSTYQETELSSSMPDLERLREGEKKIKKTYMPKEMPTMTSSHGTALTEERRLSQSKPSMANCVVEHQAYLTHHLKDKQAWTLAKYLCCAAKQRK